MSYLFAEDDIEALRSELASVRARQELLADALAAAVEELEKLKHDEDYSPAYQDEYQRLWHEARDALVQVERERDTLRAALAEANDVIHAKGYDDPEDKLRSLAVIVGMALDSAVSPEGEA